MELYRIVLPGCPPSLNRAGGQGHWRRWANAKRTWQAAIAPLLEYEQIPKDLGAITASAQLRFPVKRRRDSDNFSALLSKVLGDALQKGGWLPDDTPEHFQFEPVCFAHAPGLAEQTTILLTRGVQPSIFDGAWDTEHSMTLTPTKAQASTSGGGR